MYVYVYRERERERERERYRQATVVSPSTLLSPFFFSARVRGHLQMLLDP